MILDMTEPEILEGITSELISLTYTNPRELSYKIDCYADDYDDDSLRALIYQWEKSGYGNFAEQFPLVSQVVADLRRMNDGVDREREEYVQLIERAGEANLEVRDVLNKQSY